jgi:beta-lactamase regulating signal transducer with metallopeptidase domain
MIAATLDHIWQSTLFAGCMGLLTLTLRDNSASIRYWLWFAASVKFLVPLSVLIAASGHPILPLPETVSGPLVVDAVLQLSQPFSAASPARAMTPETVLNVNTILPTIWAAGFAAVMTMWLVRWSRINAAIRSAKPLSPTSPIPVPVKTSSSVMEPGLVGLWRPSILLPAGIETRLSKREMDTIFAHELCHMRRFDNLTAAIHMLVEASFWFYPLVWWLGARLIAEREHACDESVLASGRDPQTYAEGILKVCRFYLQSKLACASGVSGADLKKRVEAIMTHRPATRLSLARKSLLATSAAVAIALPVCAGLMAPNHAVAQPQNGNAALPDTSDVIAQRLAEQRKPRTVVPLDPRAFDQFVGYYQLDPSLVFTITRDGDHFFTRLTGQDNVEIYSESANKFFATVVAAQLSFVTDARGRATELVLHQGGMERHARRIDEAEAKTLEGAMAARIANKTPSPGTEASLRRFIDSMQSGQPNYEEMTPQLAAANRSQVSRTGPLMQSFGALKSLTFRTVNAQGMDVYDAVFEQASVEFVIAPLTSDGKVTARAWHKL